MSPLTAVRRRVLLPAVLLLLGCLLVACGGDDRATDAPQGTGVTVARLKALLDYAATPDQMWAVTSGAQGCPRCVSLWWREVDAAQWSQLHVFDDPPDYVLDPEAPTQPPADETALSMAPDGRNGFFSWADGELFATHDGGTTWAAVAGGPRGVATVSADTAYVSGRGGPWRAPVGSDDWQRFELPTPGVQDLEVTGDALTYVDARRTRETIHRSHDGGETWSSMVTGRNLCRGCQGPCTGLPDGQDAFFEECLDPRNAYAQVIRRSTDGTTWRDFADEGSYARATLAGQVFPDDDHVVVVTDRGSRLMAADGTTRDVDLDRVGTSLYGYSTFPGSPVLYAFGDIGRVWRSDDAGLTWTRVIA